MACARNSDEEEIIEVLKKMSAENHVTPKGVLTRHPSSAEALRSDVSLVRGVVVPVIAFTCLVLFGSRILFLHVVWDR